MIALTGKYATVEYRSALVDDSDFERLNAFAWKAKWNADRNNIYAVRNVRRADGSWTMVRMHREIMGLGPFAEDPREIDHHNHFGLDNRRENLRIVTRQVNIASARRVVVDGQCSRCQTPFLREVHAGGRANVSLCVPCSTTALPQHRAKRCYVSFPECAFCGVRFTARKAPAFFCSDRCRCAEERRRGDR